MTQAETKAEKAYLEKVESALDQSLGEKDAKIRSYATQLSETQRYFNESVREMDSAEKAAASEQIRATNAICDHEFLRRGQLLRLKGTPYFGRIDFTPLESSKAQRVYVGMYSFGAGETMLVHDWRSPIASLFYDSELGPASYSTPDGKAEGNVSLKRQYRIRNGQLEFMFDSSVKIDDDILQEALGQASRPRMGNIVSTIQREQNRIIRDCSSPVMLIQGVAGSGKTSIALHRVAYLLYHFRGKLTSRDILVISPNKVFADYISSVLPELGEENIARIEMDDVAKSVLGRGFRFQTFYEQVEALSLGISADAREEMEWKSSLDFARQLGQFVRSLKLNNFKAQDLCVPGDTIPAKRLQQMYLATGNIPFAQRVKELATAIAREYGIRSRERKEEIRTKILSMFLVTDAFSAYQSFFKRTGKEKWSPETKKAMNYMDVFPYIYVLLHFEHRKPKQRIRYLLIDEMQDYSPIQYMVLQALYGCDMTILGDSIQAVNPYTSSTVDAIQEVFPSATTMELNKSYRSSFEIMGLAQRIVRNEKLQVVERHGDDPEIIGCDSREKALAVVSECVSAFKASRFHSLGIVCKTHAEAVAMHHSLRTTFPDLALVDSSSEGFPGGAMVVAAHMAKGLEFDWVVVPDASDMQYRTEVDRHLLYVAVTRAMHRLTLVYSARLTPFLESTGKTKPVCRVRKTGEGDE